MEKEIQILDEKILLLLNGYAKTLPIVVNKICAEYLVYLIPLGFLIMWFSSYTAKKPVLRALFSALVGWFAIATPLGSIINRSRPFESGGVQELLFHRPTYSFPSDHATVFFAVAFSLWFSDQKRWAVFFFIIGTINAVFRVADAIHWPSDIFGGIVAGLLATWIVITLDKYLNYIYDFIIKLARKLRLA